MRLADPGQDESVKNFADLGHLGENLLSLGHENLYSAPSSSLPY